MWESVEKNCVGKCGKSGSNCFGVKFGGHHALKFGIIYSNGGHIGFNYTNNNDLGGSGNTRKTP